METSYASSCVLCPDSALDPLGHHAATCKRGGDAVLRHNKLRDILVESFHQAHIHVQVEAGSGLSHDHSNSRPADIVCLHVCMRAVCVCACVYACARASLL